MKSTRSRIRLKDLHSNEPQKASASKTDAFKEELIQKFKNGDIIHKVLEVHRKSTHYSLKRIADQMIAKCKDISREIMQESCEAYITKTEMSGKAPHPNYFIAICVQKHARSEKANSNSDTTFFGDVI